MLALAGALEAMAGDAERHVAVEAAPGGVGRRQVIGHVECGPALVGAVGDLERGKLVDPVFGADLAAPGVLPHQEEGAGRLLAMVGDRRPRRRPRLDGQEGLRPHAGSMKQQPGRNADREFVGGSEFDIVVGPDRQAFQQLGRRKRPVGHRPAIDTNVGDRDRTRRRIGQQLLGGDGLRGSAGRRSSASGPARPARTDKESDRETPRLGSIMPHTLPADAVILQHLGPEGEAVAGPFRRRHRAVLIGRIGSTQRSSFQSMYSS